MTLGIFLPTYKRAGKLQEVADNIERTTRSDFTLYLGCEKDDAESIKASQAMRYKLVVNRYDPKFGYSNTIQSIYEDSDEDVFFHANDDFEFLDGWDVAPMQFLEANPGVMVLGAHDGMPTPSYSTISFVRREYIERYSGVVDMPNRVFYPYHHNYQDTEFTYTAQARGMWAKIEIPCIKHNRIGEDETYKKNDATSSLDAVTFQAREHLWANINKEDFMPRRPMTEEQKKNLSDKAKARATAKKTEATGGATTQPDSRPSATTTGMSASIERARMLIEETMEVLIIARNENPDMIEAAQAVDALTEARNRAGQVQGMLTQ